MRTRSTIRRGEIWWVNLDPTIGGEARKTRPAVIVSNDRANAAQNRVQVLPCTSIVSAIYPWEAPVTIGGRTSKAMADQIRTASKARLTSRIGTVSSQEMEGIEDATRLRLGL